MSYQSQGNGKNKQYWTPRWLVRAIEDTLKVRFVADMAACAKSTVADEYYDGSPGRDALEADWGAVINYHRRVHEGIPGPEPVLWCNPPWHLIGEFLRRCEGTGGDAVFCLPNRLEAAWGSLAVGLPVTVLAPRINYFDPDLGRIKTGNGIGTVLVRTGHVQPYWHRLNVSHYRPKKEGTLPWPV